MKAIVYTKKRVPDRLSYQEVEKPVPEKNQILVKVFSSSVNAADYRSMKMGMIPKKKIFGADISGVVEAVGDGVRGFVPGDEVVGVLSNSGFGGFADYALAPEAGLTLMPKGLSFEDSAALPLAGITALQALRDKGGIGAGQKVLIVGSGGGVGSFAVQLAKFYGTTVTAVCSGGNAEQAFNLGADEVLDYAKTDFLNRIGYYDLIVAINGNYSLSACKKCLKPNGRYVMVGGDLPQIFKALVFGKLLSFGSRKIRSLMAKPNRNDLEFIVKLAGEGKIKPLIDKTYPLEKTSEATRYAAAGHARGKISIKVR